MLRTGYLTAECQIISTDSTTPKHVSKIAVLKISGRKETNCWIPIYNINYKFYSRGLAELAKNYSFEPFNDVKIRVSFFI